MVGATFTVRVENGAIVIEDLDRGRSVTNDAEAVIATLRARGYDLSLPVIYRDTMGRWDGLRVEGEAFAGFYPLGGAETYAEARAALKAMGGDTTGTADGQAALHAVRATRQDPFSAALDLDTWEEVTVPRTVLTSR